MKFLPFTFAFFPLLSLAEGAPVRLTSPRMEVSLSESTGEVIAVRHGERLLVENVGSIYDLYTQTGKQSISGEKDRVVSVQTDSNTRATFEVVNPALEGVTLRKSYRLEDEGTRLVMETTARFETTQEAFLGFLSRVHLANDFRTGGFYSDPSRHVKTDSRLPAEKLVKEVTPRIEGFADWHRVIFTDNLRKTSLLHERTRVDGLPVTPITNHGYERTLRYSDTGWTLGLEAAKIEAGRTTTQEWTLALVQGDQTMAWQAARSLPGYREMNDYQTPEWVGHVKYFHAHSLNADDHEFSWVKQVLESTDEGEILVLFADVWGEEDLGSYPTTGEWTGRQGRVSQQQIREMVDRLHAMSPRVKVAVYTWWWGFSTKGRFAREHPEWLIRDAEGRHVYTQIGPALERTYAVNLTPEMRQHVHDRVRAIMTDFNLDVLYLDGGQGGVNAFDWKTMTKASDGEWTRLYKEMLEIVRGLGKEKAFWSNGATGLYTAYTDCGYFEGFSDPEDWRGLSERMMMVKSFTALPRWTAPLYLHPTNARRYLNTLFLLGMSPPSYSAGHYSARKILRQRAPIDLMAELGGSELLNQSGFQPKWWQGAGEEEIYLHRLKGHLLLTGMTHSKTPKAKSVTIPKADLASEERAMVWRWNVADFDVCDQFRHDTGAAIEKTYEQHGLLPDALVGMTLEGMAQETGGAIELEFPLRHRTPSAFYLTTVPAVILAEEGRPMMSWQSATEKTRLEGRLIGDDAEVTVNATAQTEVLIVIPARAATLTINGKESEVNVRAGVAPEGWSAVTVSLSEGVHQLKLNGTAPKQEAAAFTLSLGEENDQLVVKSDLNQPVAVTLLRDGIPVAWRTDREAVRFPKALLEPGIYSAIAEGGGNKAVSDTVAVESAVPKIESALVNVANSERSSAKGLELLGSWEQTVGHSDFNFAKVDRENLRLDAGIGPRLYGYGHAGIDIAKADSLLLKAKITAPPAGVPYHFRHNAFLGMTIDFHTPKGWKRRSWIALGTQAQRTNAVALPRWGTNSEGAAPGPDSNYADLTREFADRNEQDLWIDLASYAPEEWDGRIILGAVDRVAGKGTRVELEVLAVNQPYPEGKALAVRQELDFSKFLRDAGLLVTSSPVTAKGLDIESGLHHPEFSAGTLTPKLAKVLVTGPKSAGGFLTSNARLLTLKVTKNGAARDAWVLADFHDKEKGFAKRVIYPLGGTTGSCSLPPPTTAPQEVVTAKALPYGSWSQTDFVEQMPDDSNGTVLLWLVSSEDAPDDARVAIEVIENVDSYRY